MVEESTWRLKVNGQYGIWTLQEKFFLLIRKKQKNREVLILLWILVFWYVILSDQLRRWFQGFQKHFA